MSKVLGIDLGTNKSVVAIEKDNENIIIPNDKGEKRTPSIIAFSEKEQILVGKEAKNYLITNPDRAISNIKEKIATNYKIKIDNQTYKAEEIAAILLQKLKEYAQKYLKEEINEATIAAPSNFTYQQKQTLKQAGKIAGLNILTAINENTAILSAYKLNKKEKAENVLIFDLGAGSFKLSIIEISKDVYNIKSNIIDSNLNGNEWNKKIIDWIIKSFKRKTRIDLSKDKIATIRIKEAAERAKIELSSVNNTQIYLPYIYADNSGPKNLDLNLTRSEFEKISKDLMKKLDNYIKKAIKESKIKPREIEKIILVGGSSQMPMIKNLLKRIFKKDINDDINPQFCVALGAAIEGEILKKEINAIN